MHCPHCGAPLEPDSKFCAVCGTRVDLAQGGAAAGAGATAAPAPAPRPTPRAAAPGAYTQPTPSPRGGASGAVAAPAPRVAPAPQMTPAPRTAPAPHSVSAHVAAPGAAPRTPTSESRISSQQMFPYDVMRFRRYFDKQSRALYWVALVVAVIAFLSVIPLFPTNLLCLLVAVGCGLYLWWLANNTATDAEVDQMYNLFERMGISEGYAKVGMQTESAKDRRGEPFYLAGPNYANTPARCWIHITYDAGLKSKLDLMRAFHLGFLTKGVENRLIETAEVRSNNYQVTALYPMRNMLRYYILQQSLTRSKRFVTAGDVYYDDIVNLDIVEKYYENDDNSELRVQDSSGNGTLVLNLTSGKTLEIPFTKSQYDQVVSIRTLLRDCRRESNRLLEGQLKRLRNIDESTAL